MEVESVDYTKIPLSALQKVTQNVLSTGLNQHKVIPNKDGLPRDWRGLAHLIGLNGVEMRWIETTPDPFLTLLNHWGKKGNIDLLQNYLKTLDRYDVLDDAKQLFESNSLEYLKCLNNLNSSVSCLNLESDKIILTTDDVVRLENGLEPQIYDAYLLYAEEDSNFATEIVETMESKYKLKLCVKDRDLIGGVQFEHDAITKLIAERCRRLVVIVSPNFLKSKANKFFVTFAQALGLDIRERKVIPILYEKCNVPPELSYYFFLDYNRANKLWNFWEKLRDSIQGPELYEKSVKLSNAQSAQDFWISRTHFEEKKEEPGSSNIETHAGSETLKSSSKTKNVYKLLKNSFVKSLKNSTNQDLENSDGKRSNSIMANLSSFLTNDNKVLIEYYENSSSSLEGSENNIDDKKKFKKKKWFKKKNVEPLLS